MNKFLFAVVSLVFLNTNIQAQEMPTPKEETKCTYNDDKTKDTETIIKYDDAGKIKEEAVIRYGYFSNKMSNKKTTTKLFDISGQVISEVFEELRYDYISGDIIQKNVNKSTLVVGALKATYQYSELVGFQKTIIESKFDQTTGKLIEVITREFDETSIDNCIVTTYSPKTASKEVETTYKYTYDDRLTFVDVTVQNKRNEITELRSYDFSSDYSAYNYFHKKGPALSYKEKKAEAKLIVSLMAGDIK